MARRRYTKDFKRQAVQRALEGDCSQREIAEELGISTETLYRWKAEHQRDPEEAFPGNGNRKERDRELDELRRRVLRLETENSFLKKVSGYFARGQK